MSLNQIPYTNIHELNLNWILAKIKEFESRLDAIEDYGEDIATLKTDVKNLETALSNLKTSVNASLTLLNSRCTALEDGQDELKESINALYISVAEQLLSITEQFDAINASLASMKAYNDSSNLIVLNEAKEYTRERIAYLLELFSDPKDIYLVNPWNNQIINIQEFADYLYNLLHFSALTCAEFDAMGLTAAEFDSLGITCEEFDNWGKWAFFFYKAYVTESSLMEILENYATKDDIAGLATKAELEQYATLNDIKVFNPTTGLLGSVQTAILSLAALHQNGLTAKQFDDTELTAGEFDALQLTAFEFDFYGLIKFINEGIISGTLVGLTAEQYQNIVVGESGQLFTLVHS